MCLKNQLKHVLFKMPPFIKDGFYKFYNLFFYSEMLEKKRSYGDLYPDKTFYVIRPRKDGVEGLMSLYMNVIRNIDYSEKKGYIPIVDFENYKTQYMDSEIEKSNVWEYYFENLSKYSLLEVYSSKNVILSGLDVLTIYSDKRTHQKFDEKSLVYVRNLVKKYIKINDETISFLNKELTNFKLDKTLGLYLRGTDYTKLKPSGHPIQPSVEMALKKSDEFLKANNLDYVFLVTEDEEIYKKVKSYYNKKLIVVSFDTFISDYKGDTYLSKNKQYFDNMKLTPYQRGLNYFCKILILSKCNSIVGGNTCGSWAACSLSEGYKNTYIFDLGRY